MIGTHVRLRAISSTYVDRVGAGLAGFSGPWDVSLWVVRRQYRAVVRRTVIVVRG